MHHFNYKEDQLYCEEIPIQKIAEAVGTPFYLYSHATLNRHFHAFDNAFKDVDRLVCYSAKANTNLAILRLLRNLGSGLDIVSGGELYRGLKAGFSPDKIVYSGVGKRVDEIDFALNSEILMFNIESLQELEVIDARAGALGKKARVAIRVNPNVDPGTHPYISTGLSKNKFGIDIQSAITAYQTAHEMANVEVVGVDCHIGSQITDATPFKDALKSLMALISQLGEMGINVKYLDMGGGLGITYGDEKPPHPDEYARAILETLKDSGLKLIFEPGRVIVGNAGILVTQVLYRKKGVQKEFAIVDAGMNDLLRPTLYSAFHDILPVQKNNAGTVKADVVGPICESGDFLAQDRDIADVTSGGLLAVMSAGAYAYTMASNYCSRLKVPEVMVDGDTYHVVSQRETYEDLTRRESIPPFLEK